MKEHLLIRAARGETVERTPVWAMRQAGRWDPEFNKLRQGLSFFEFSENVELAARASLCPRRFGVDAVILFYDIATLAIAMGLPFQLVPGKGPLPDQPIRSLADVERLAARPDPQRYSHIIKLLGAVRRELADELPVLVFAGAPFTLASYCIGLGKDLPAVLKFAESEPAVWARLLDRIAEATSEFLNELIRGGAAAYQLFDSWAGGLSARDYSAWASDYHRQIFRTSYHVPRILFVKECPYLETMAASGADIISLGVSHDLATAQSRFPNLVFQGNVNDRLLATGSPNDVRTATIDCLRQGGGRRHILNLSHGMNKDAKPENFAAFVETARDFGRNGI